MELRDYYKRLGREPTVTFGCANPPEIVGPVKPREVQYGVNYGNFTPLRTHPSLFLNFNKYRPDLPPWHNVVEAVLASKTDDGVFEATFIDTDHLATSTTGDLKTVNLVADTVAEGVESAAIIERSEVAEKRNMRGVRGSNEFRVTEDLK
jgi:hypothetical protein